MKKMIILLSAILLVGLCTVRIYWVNASVKLPECIIYEEGCWAEFGNDGQNSAGESPGYCLRTTGYRVISVEDLITLYPILKNQSLDSNILYYILVDATAKNTNFEDSNDFGISLLNYMLVGTSYLIMEDSILFLAINPELPGDTFSLRANSEIAFTIPYPVRKNDCISREELDANPPLLEITEYPHRKLLRI